MEGTLRGFEHAVVVAGGALAGTMLSAELALAGVDVAVVARRPDHVLVGSRAGGLHARTLEVLDQRGGPPPTGTGECCWPATQPTCTIRPVGRS